MLVLAAHAGRVEGEAPAERTCLENLDWLYAAVVYFRAHMGASRPHPGEEAIMPIKDQELHAELNGMQAVDSHLPQLPTECQACTSGGIMFTPAIIADVVNVEL
jgi:hypothetical protein